MIFIWFIYGLAFFALGLVIVVYPKKGSMFRLANHLWLIAGFGLLHGINEWLDMFIAIGQPLSPETLKILRMITLSGSFLFLLRFGTKVIVEANKKFRLLEALPLVLFAVWLTILVISTERLLIGDITARYLLCAPGAVLTSLGLFLQIPQFKETKLQGVVRSLQLAAVTFLLYAVLAGLIVKKGFFPGADPLTYDVFRNTFGAPVQIFRAGCAAILAGSIAYVLSVFRWETQQALYRSEQRCRTIASTMPVILFVQNSDSIITFIQGKGLAVLGLKDDEIIGKRFAQVIPSVPELEDNTRQALSGEEFGTTITINDFAFEFYYSPVSDRDGEVTGLIGVALDVTSKVEAQKELDEYRRRMEKTTYLAEVGSMGSVMAQKLNEPLAVTRLMLQRVLADLGGSRFDDDDTDVKSLSKALSEVSKAAEIVNRFQSTAQVTSRINAEPVDLYQITKRIIAVFAQSARRANLTMSVKDMDAVFNLAIPARQLEQVFFILVQNAIDRADTGEKRKLTISCHISAGQVELRFSDTCGGIEPEKLKGIFEPFFTATAGTKDTGLGLAVAKRVICDHDGSITAESRPGRGTTFYVTLPIEGA